MKPDDNNSTGQHKKQLVVFCLSLVVIGFGTFIFVLMGRHPERA